MALKKVIEGIIFPDLELECFVSKVDIDSGTDWWMTIRSELKTCQLGIVCVTNENVHAPWIFYEAGGMAARNVPVIPLLIGCGMDSLSDSPLRGKQCVNFEIREEFIKMITDMNDQLGKLLPDAVTVQMAEKGYDELNKNLKSVMNVLKNNKPYFHSYSEKSHDAGSLIRNAQNDIFVATAVGNKFLKTHGDEIEEKLKAGIQVRYMMLDINRFHEMEEYLHGVYKKDKDIHIEVSEKLRDWKKRYPDLVEAKFFQGYLTASYIGIDIWPDAIQESSLIQIMMYQYRVRARQSPIMYNFPKTDEKSYITTVESVKNMWRDGKPLFV